MVYKLRALYEKQNPITTTFKNRQKDVTSTCSKRSSKLKCATGRNMQHHFSQWLKTRLQLRTMILFCKLYRWSQTALCEGKWNQWETLIIYKEYWWIIGTKISTFQSKVQHYTYFLTIYGSVQLIIYALNNLLNMFLSCYKYCYRYWFNATICKLTVQFPVHLMLNLECWFVNLFKVVLYSLAIL